MELLERLFGSTAKVKLLRLFLFNAEQVFSVSTIKERSKLKPEQLRRELLNLQKMGLIRKKAIKKSSGDNAVWALNENFPYLEPLRGLLVTISPVTHEDVIRKLQKAGKVKAVILSGIFIHRSDSRADILVIGDQIKKGILTGVMKNLESDMGRELRYAALETEDFKYRRNVGDRLIRDILDYPHEIVLDKMGVKS
jgi:hypothetical protein